MAQSPTGGTLQVRIAGVNEPVLAEINIPPGQAWTTRKVSLKKVPAGIHDIIVTLKNGTSVQVDWIRFE